MSFWSARLELGFHMRQGKTILAERRQEGPLVVQKPLYPEGEAVCHAIVVHPPGGIAGGDELELKSSVAKGAHALLTTPGAGKWYRSAGAHAKQSLRFEVGGSLEWLPRETIVFNDARARLECAVELKGDARYIGWEVLCLGRAGAGERFSSGEVILETTIACDGRLLWLERGRIESGGSLPQSPAGLGGHSVCGTLIAAGPVDAQIVAACRNAGGDRVAVTLVPGVMIARYLGDSSEEAMRAFAALWAALRPATIGRQAIEPRIWRT
ncbi:MAG: urease accessory protein UreD [Burkholderiales bacterium]